MSTIIKPNLNTKPIANFRCEENIGQRWGRKQNNKKQGDSKLRSAYLQYKKEHTCLVSNSRCHLRASQKSCPISPQ